LVIDKKLYVANAGDSKAVLLSLNEDGTFEAQNVSTTFNANKKSE
jgi:serine/threonine protein phosphatase PrpC